MEHKTIVLGNECGFAGIDCKAFKAFENFSDLRNIIYWYLAEDNYKDDINLYNSFLKINYNVSLIQNGIKKALEIIYERSCS